MKILNLTQHPATPAQIEAGVVEPQDKGWVRELLTFTDLPDALELYLTAKDLAFIAAEEGVTAAMIGGAPYLMQPLVERLKMENIQPLFAFTRRESIEAQDEDGNVRKTATFRHLGFVTP